MDTQTQIKNIANAHDRIIGSEGRWKAMYMASWNYARDTLQKNYENTPHWNQRWTYNLPGSKKSFQEYTQKELYEILTTKNVEFTLGHLQTIFTLFEVFLFDVVQLVYPNSKFDSSKFNQIKEVLNGLPPYTSININISTLELSELDLAKETRNCFIHRNSKVDKKWKDKYYDVRQIQAPVNIEDDLPISLHQVEDWHDLIATIADRIMVEIRKLYP